MKDWEHEVEHVEVVCEQVLFTPSTPSEPEIGAHLSRFEKWAEMYGRWREGMIIAHPGIIPGNDRRVAP